MTPEIFVLNLLRPDGMGVHGAGSRGERPEWIENTGRWKKAFAFAESVHSTLPFLAALCRCSWYGEVPAAARLRFDERLQRERMLLAVLEDEMDIAVNRLVEARVPVIIVKGMDLAKRFYPDRIFRPMADIDLLVPESSFSRALSVMGRAGYRLAAPFPEGRIRVELQRPVHNGAGAGIVELHRRLLTSDSEEETAAIWSRSVEGKMNDLPRAVRTLTDTDYLVYLVRHAAVQHLLESPVWLNDIHFLILKSDGVDWDEVVWRLADKRAVNAGFFVLSYLRENFGSPVPDQVLADLGGRTGRRRRRELSRLASSPVEWFAPPKKGYHWLVRSRYLMRDGVLEAFKYGVNRTFGILAVRREMRRSSNQTQTAGTAVP